ncbi:MAG: hypothetical protein IKR17_12130 [Bacteroidales bacterium]|nr:hypothetical protein [Bacteroidales bacterium]
MKRIALIFIATLVLAVLGSFANYSYNGSNITTSVSVGDNLALDENIFVDMIFNKDGHLLENNVYEWNTETDTKGRLLVSTKHETWANVVDDASDFSSDKMAQLNK